MRVVIVGLGIQGNKRITSIKNDLSFTVDPNVESATYSDIRDIPVNKYDAAVVCTPERVKKSLLYYLIDQKKHVLCEKPLLLEKNQLLQLQARCRRNKVYLQVAYNHRFEPSVQKMKKIIDSKKLGNIYSLRMFYGNGTAKLVNKSNWRDQGLGVIQDLGSHLLDLYRLWFPKGLQDFKLINYDNFENNSPDYLLGCSSEIKPRVQIEATYLMWKNSFTCDLIAEKGSAHIGGLIKWGKSFFELRRRVFPAGPPSNKTFWFDGADPTWNLEYKNFKQSIKLRKLTDLSDDIYISNQLLRMQNHISKEIR